MKLTRLLTFACFIVSLAVVQAQRGTLLYSGLTESNGWQIFRYECSSNTYSQITFSLGDKREPQYSRPLDCTICRNSRGEILQISRKGEALLTTNMERCTAFVLAPDGRSVFFTKPSSEYTRQNIWEQKSGETAPVLAAAAPDGVLIQAAPSPDGQWLAAIHAWQGRRGAEERLVIFSVDHGEFIRYLTPEQSSDAFPSWSVDSKCLLFSCLGPSRKYALKEVCLAKKETTTLLSLSDASICHPVSDSSGQYIFFEMRTPQRCSIACLDRKSGGFRPLLIPQEAREPFWYENN